MVTSVSRPLISNSDPRDEDELVVLVGPSGPLGDQIQSVLATWCHAELLRPSYWVSPQDMTRGVIDAIRLDSDGAQPVRLPDHLGATIYRAGRVVLVQPLSPK